MSRQERTAIIEAAKEKLLLNEQAADKATKELYLLYDEAAANVEGEIYKLYGKYASDNSLSAAEARRLLGGAEHNVWRKNLERYIQGLPKEAKGSKALIELNTLAMKSRISREEQLLGEIYRNMMELAGDCSANLTEALGDVVRSNYLHSCYSVQKGMRMGFSIARIDESLVRRILEHPWSSKTFSANIWEKTDVLAALARREIAAGMIEGSSADRMAKKINDVMQAGKKNAVRLVRTECKHFACEGEIEGYKANGILEYTFVGGSERSAHCECASHNGKVYSVKKAGDDDNPLPPLHPNCLCTVIAKFALGMFDRLDTEPLADNMKYQAWAEKYAKRSG